jgi:hypothetical protein
LRCINTTRELYSELPYCISGLRLLQRLTVLSLSLPPHVTYSPVHPSKIFVPALCSCWRQHFSSVRELLRSKCQPFAFFLCQSTSSASVFLVPALSGASPFSGASLFWCQPFPVPAFFWCQPFPVPALFWSQPFSGPSPFRCQPFSGLNPFWCQPFSGASPFPALVSALFRPVLHQYWVFVSLISKVLVSANLPMLALRDVHLSQACYFFSRHTCSPCSPFFSRVSAFLVSAFFSYQRTSGSPVALFSTLPLNLGT